MIEIQPWLITGPGGSRIDFIAGWLGYLPNFCNNNWSVDPITGQSFGNMRSFKNFDNYNSSLQSYLSTLGDYQISNTSLKWSGSLHGFNLKDEITDENVVIAHIHVPQQFHKKVNWEFFVKTYCSKPMVFGQDHSLTIGFQFDTMKKMKYEQLNIEPHPRAIILDYESLFYDGGSKYLCSKLNIEASDRLHEYYNDMLKWADSPLEVEAYGKTWKFSDFNG
jgi:hypothetical protein